MFNVFIGFIKIHLLIKIGSIPREKPASSAAKVDLNLHNKK